MTGLTDTPLAKATARESLDPSDWKEALASGAVEAVKESGLEEQLSTWLSEALPAKSNQQVS